MLIKFAAISNKNHIANDYEYIDEMLIELSDKGYIDCYELYTEDEYPTVFFCDVKKDKKAIRLAFEIETYVDVKQLVIDIIAEEYSMDITDAYLENFKLYIKNYLIKDWEKIIWLYDDDAYILSNDLYSRLYTTENRFRRFIHEFMFKTIGLEWWDTLSDLKIKDKYQSRIKEYRAVVSGFNKVDDHLISIDVGDLLKIMTMKKRSWQPTYDVDIENMLIGTTEGKERKIVDRLKKQLVIKEDLWDKYFENYFDDDFVKLFDEFKANRNHVAHNKILDRAAYKSIRRSIDKMDEYVQRAFSKMYNEKKSLEQSKAEAHEYDEMLLEVKQSEAGVNIRTINGIIEEFETVLTESYMDIVEALRFRDDIEISRMNFDSTKYSGMLFYVVSRVSKKTINFYYSMEINDEEGAESVLTITCEHRAFVIEKHYDAKNLYVSITYKNGEVEYDDEQGYYKPVSEDGIVKGDVENYVDTIIDFINTEVENFKVYIESIRYEIVKDGGNLPIALGVYCDECYEEYICIDANLAEVGTCLNCGAHNNIFECERCGHYYNEYNEDEVKICNNCKEQIKKQ